MKVEIVGFENSSYQIVVTGLKGKHYYENQPALGGYTSYGSFKSYPIPQCFVKWRNPKNGRLESQDIRAWLKNATAGKRLTASYLNQLTSANRGKLVEACWSDEEGCRILANLNQLTIV